MVGEYSVVKNATNNQGDRDEQQPAFNSRAGFNRRCRCRRSVEWRGRRCCDGDLFDDQRRADGSRHCGYSLSAFDLGQGTSPVRGALIDLALAAIYGMVFSLIDQLIGRGEIDRWVAAR